jgi:hypothetical protein
MEKRSIINLPLYQNYHHLTLSRKIDSKSILRFFHDMDLTVLECTDTEIENPIVLCEQVFTNHAIDWLERNMVKFTTVYVDYKLYIGFWDRSAALLFKLKFL